MTDVVLKSFQGRKAVGGGRNREGDRLELMVLMLSFKVAIWSKVVKIIREINQGHCDLLLYLEKREEK